MLKCERVLPLPSAGPLHYSKAGNRERATCSATLMQNELNSDVPRFAICVQTCFATNKVVRVFFVGGKRRKIAIQLVLQQSRKTSCTFSVARSWKSIAILVGSIIYGEIPFLENEKKNCRYGSFTFYTAISKKVLGKTVHTTIPKGIMGYDQCTFRETVAVESTFVAFL